MRQIIPQSSSEGRNRLFLELGIAPPKTIEKRAEDLGPSRRVKDGPSLPFWRPSTSGRGMVGIEEFSPKPLESELVSRASQYLSQKLEEMGITSTELELESVNIEKVSTKGVLKKSPVAESATVDFQLTTPLIKLHSLKPHTVQVVFENGRPSDIVTQGYEVTSSVLEQKEKDKLSKKAARPRLYNFESFVVDDDGSTGSMRHLGSVVNPGRVKDELEKRGFSVWRVDPQTYDVVTTHFEAEDALEIVSAVGVSPEAEEDFEEPTLLDDLDTMAEALDGVLQNLTV